MPALIGRVDAVIPHPKNEELNNRLDIVTLLMPDKGVKNVANRPKPDEPRYKVGDYAIVLHENLILPEWLLRHLDLWDASKGKGFLAGNKGNRTKGKTIQGVLSEVALVKVQTWISPPERVLNLEGYVYHHMKWWVEGEDFLCPSAFCMKLVKEGEAVSIEGMDCTWSLGVEHYIPEN